MRRSLPILVLALAAAGCGGGSSHSAPKDLLDPAKLSEKAPLRFDCVFHTTAGDFTITVRRTWAPHGADRFYNLCKHGFYDGARIFRVVPGFVAQFGISPYPAVSQAWQNATIPDDAAQAHNGRGAVAFASAGPNSRTTQIFVDLAANDQLDAQFPPFGAVSSGMKTVDALYSGYGDTPTSNQPQMTSHGNAYIDAHWPKLDAVVSTKVQLP